MLYGGLKRKKKKLKILRLSCVFRKLHCQKKTQVGQVIGYDSPADTYHEELLPEFAQKYNRWGLGLNAAVLGTLVNHVGNYTDVSAVFSGRVPENVIRDMINELGWKVVEVVQTPEPIQQDPDTDIAFVSEYANTTYEDLFYEKKMVKNLTQSRQMKRREDCSWQTKRGIILMFTIMLQFGT